MLFCICWVASSPAEFGLDAFGLCSDYFVRSSLTFSLASSRSLQFSKISSIFLVSASLASFSIVSHALDISIAFPFLLCKSDFSLPRITSGGFETAAPVCEDVYKISLFFLLFLFYFCYPLFPAWLIEGMEAKKMEESGMPVFQASQKIFPRSLTHLTMCMGKIFAVLDSSIFFAMLKMTRTAKDNIKKKRQTNEIL